MKSIVFHQVLPISKTEDGKTLGKTAYHSQHFIRLTKEPNVLRCRDKMKNCKMLALKEQAQPSRQKASDRGSLIAPFYRCSSLSNQVCVDRACLPSCRYADDEEKCCFRVDCLCTKSSGKTFPNGLYLTEINGLRSMTRKTSIDDHDSSDKTKEKGDKSSEVFPENDSSFEGRGSKSKRLLQL